LLDCRFCALLKLALPAAGIQTMSESDTLSSIPEDDVQPQSRTRFQRLSGSSIVLRTLLLLPLLLLASLLSVALVRNLVGPRRATHLLPLHFDYHAPAGPAASAPLPRLPPGLRFDLSLSLLLPESPLNRALGVFQLEASVLAADGRSLAAASVPCQLLYRSLPVRLARTALRLPLLALGSASEAQTVALPSLLNSVGGDGVTLRVTLRPLAGAPPGAPQVYSALAELRLRLGLAQRILYSYPLSSSLALFSCAFGFYTGLAAALFIFHGRLAPRPPQPASGAAVLAYSQAEAKARWRAAAGLASDGSDAGREEAVETVFEEAFVGGAGASETEVEETDVEESNVPGAAGGKSPAEGGMRQRRRA
jgi:hypothetical protein